MTRLVPKLIQSFLSNIFVYQPLYMYNDYINIDALAYNGDELHYLGTCNFDINTLTVLNVYGMNPAVIVISLYNKRCSNPTNLFGQCDERLVNFSATHLFVSGSDFHSLPAPKQFRILFHTRRTQSRRQGYITLA